MQFNEIKNKYNTIIFDNDGVILDSNQAKTDAFIKSIQGNEISKIQEFINYHTDNGGVSRFEKLEHFYKNILNIENYEDQLRKSLNIYATFAKKSMLEANLIDGVIDFIEKIFVSDKLIHVISGSDQEELIEIYKDRGIKKYFNQILGSPTSKDTHARQLLESKEVLYPVIYFGDSITDFNVADEYSMDFIFVSSKSEWKQGINICQEADCKIIQDFKDIL
jgi:phosphoglycolate phosphatase-like HAD superfamily hydrolase